MLIFQISNTEDYMIPQRYCRFKKSMEEEIGDKIFQILKWMYENFHLAIASD